MRKTVGLVSTIALLVGACGGGGDGGGDALPTAGAVTAVGATVDRLSALDADAVGDGPCPFEVEASLEAVFADISADPPLRVLTDRSEGFSDVFVWSDPPIGFQCSLASSFDEVGVIVEESTGDFEAYINEIFDGDEEAILELAKTGNAYGGQLYDYCSTHPDRIDFCAINWESDDLVVSVFLERGGVPDDPLDDIRAAFVDRLPALVEAIAASS